MSSARVKFGYCLCGEAARSKDVVFADGLDHRHATLYDGISPHGHYCVPILLKGIVVGVLNLYLAEGHVESEFEQGFLVAVARIMATVIGRRRPAE